MSTQTQTPDDPNEIVPHGYEKTNKKAYGSQRECARAWGRMKWPTHNSMSAEESAGVPHTARSDGRTVGADRMAEVYSSDNFRGYQFDVGAGVLMHYRTRESIRTKHGLTINNHQCWAGGFAHCSPAPNADATVPLSAVQNFLEDNHSIYDISAVGGGLHNPTGLAVEIDGGDYYVFIGRDPSIINGDSYFAFRKGGFPYAGFHSRDSEFISDFIEKELTPDPVLESDLAVVDSAEYTKTYLNNAERENHIKHGGNVVESNSRWRDRLINRQQYRADLRGNVIVRHGEWFFIPMSDASVSPEDIDRAEGDGRMGNHRAIRSGGKAVKPSGVMYVRGQIIHANGDHNAVNLGERWHWAVLDDTDVLVYDTAPGRSRGRSRGGWD